jgi:hypothetical protein
LLSPVGERCGALLSWPARYPPPSEAFLFRGEFCSDAANLPPEYFRDIRTACEEGVSDEELQELTKIRAASDTDRAP